MSHNNQRNAVKTWAPQNQRNIKASRHPRISRKYRCGWIAHMDDEFVLDCFPHQPPPNQRQVTGIPDCTTVRPQHNRTLAAIRNQSLSHKLHPIHSKFPESKDQVCLTQHQCPASTQESKGKEQTGVKGQQEVGHARGIASMGVCRNGHSWEDSSLGAKHGPLCHFKGESVSAAWRSPELHQELSATKVGFPVCFWCVFV